MFNLNKKFIGDFFHVLLLIVFVISCSPASSSSGSSGSSPPSVREAVVQLRSTLGEGITGSGSGSQSDPFEILIDESVSLERPSLALSELFSNVASVAEGQSKVGAARLDITGLTVEPGLGSKLSIELKASNNEKKYANLYFQDSARLTNAVQSGGAVLDSVARGGVAKAVEVVVTVYKEEAEDGSWNVALDSLFDYNEQKFDVTAFKEGEETQNARFVQESKTEITDFTNYTITEEAVVELVFEPKEGVDPLLYPARSQLLRLVPDAKVMSSLAFNGVGWTDDSKDNEGGSPEDARVIKSVWNEALDLLFYVDAGSETLTVKLYEVVNLNIILPNAGGTVAEGDTLKPPEFDKDDNTKHKFKITAESPSAIFEFSTADSDSIVGKKLYVKFSALKKDSSFGLETLPDNRTSSGTGVDFDNAFSISGAFPANTAVNLKTLVDETSATGNLTYTTVTSANDASPGSITNPAAALNDQDGTSVVVRVVDSGSLEVKAKTIFLKLSFASATLEPSSAYPRTEAKDGSSSDKAILVPKIAQDASLTLADLIAPYSGTVTYALSRTGVSEDMLGNEVTFLSIGQDSIDHVGPWTIKVSGTPPGETVATKVLYFEVTFTKKASSLVKNSDYDTDSGTGISTDPYVSTVAAGSTLTLADLTTGKSAGGTLSYTVGGTATTAATLKVGVNSFTAGVKAIVVSDTGDANTAAGSVHFSIDFAQNASSLVKNSDYDTDSGTGISTDPYVSTVAAGSTLTLADLTTGKSAGGTLSYTVGGTATTAATLKVGVDSFTAGTKTIVVSDTGDVNTAAGSVHFSIDFAQNASSLVKNSDYSTTSGTGISTDPYVSTVAAGATLTLADLTTGKSAGGTLSYTVGGTPTTATSLKVGVDSFTAGTKTIVVSDTGDVNTAAGSVHFSINFAQNASSLVKDSDYSTTSGTGISTDPYVSTVAAGATLTLADLTTGKSAGGTLSYTVDGTPTTAATLKVGVNSFTAGTKTIVVSDTGDANTAAGSVHFSIDFTKNASSLVKDSGYSTTSGTGISTDPYVSTVAAGATLTLADLTTGKSAGGTLSYTVGGTPTTAATLKVGVDSFTAGTKTIVVSDTGDVNTAAGSVHFSIDFAQNASSLVKNSDYSTTSGTGISTDPYVSTVAAGATLTLADLTTGKSAGGTLSYTVGGTPTTATSLKVGVDSFTAGTKTIVVSDTGDVNTAAGSVHFSINFAQNASSLVKDSDYSTTSGTGISTDPYVSTVAAGATLTLADLTTGKSAGGTLSYTVDGTPTTAATLKVGVNSFTAGTKTIVVSDTGDANTAAGSVHFSIDFTKNASSLVKDSGYSTTSGTGISTDPYVSTVAAGATLTLADLTTGKSAGGTLSYTVGGTPTTATSLKVGVDSFTAGTKTIVVSDTGDVNTAADSVHFSINFAQNASSLVKDSDYSTTSGTGISTDPYVSTVAAGATLTLADLTTGKSAGGTLSYTVDGTPTTAATLKVGVNSFTAGTKTIVVSDTGDANTAAGSVHFSIDFTKNASSLVKDSGYSTTSGTGISTDPYVSTVAAGATLTLADLTTGKSAGGTLSYTVGGTPTTATSLKVGEVFAGTTKLSSGENTIVVNDSGDAFTAASSITFKVNFTKNSSTFKKSDSYSATGSGTDDAPYVSTVAADTSLTLADLTTGSVGTLSYTVGGTPTTAASLKVGEPLVADGAVLSAGEKTIIVTDSGDNFTAGKVITFKVNFLPFPSTFAFQDQLPPGYDITGTGANFANAAILTVNGGTLPANTAVNLTALFKNFAAPVADRLYETVTSATVTGAKINTPTSALGDKAGESVVVKVTDPDSATVASNTLYLSLAFATVPPTQDNRYTTVALRSGGPEVALTGSMAAGEISFSVELLANTTQVIYSSKLNGSEFKYLYRDFDEENDDFDLVLFASGTGDVPLKADLPAGVYNFTLVKALSGNGYTAKVSVADADGVALILDDTANLSFHTIEITNNNVQAFTDPVIGADADSTNRRPVRVVNNVQWAFQPAAPQVSLFGGDGFSVLAAGASVGSTFFVRIPDLVAGDRFELFSATNDQTSSRNQTKTVAAGETSLEFEVSGLTHGTVYEFLVKPADSSANLLDSPASVTVSVDTSVPQTNAAFIGLSSFATQNGRTNLQGLIITPVNGKTDVFAIGDQIFLYEINTDNERVAVGNATGLAHTFDETKFPQYIGSPSFPMLGVDLSGMSFEERAYNLVVEVVTPLGNKADADFTVGHGETNTVFSVTLDFTSPQISFNFTDTSTFVISANEALAADFKADIESGLTFTDTQGNSLSITPTATYRTGSSDYEVSLSPALSGRVVLNLAAETVIDVAGNGNVGIQQNVFPSLLSIVASSNRIDAGSTSTTLTFNFAQQIDAATFSPAADLEIVDLNNMALSGNLPTFSNVSPNTGASQTIRITLNAPNGFDNQVSVSMKADSAISLPGISLAAAVKGQSPPIDIDRKAPTPTVSFAAAQVAPSAAVQFTLSFDEAVTGDIAVTDFQVGTAANLADATAAILSNISRKDETTFTGTLTTPDTETAYLLVLKANAVTDAYANANSVSNTATINVVNGAVPVPSFSAPPLARHGGSTTLTISFPEGVTGFAVGDLNVTDVNNASTVGLGTLKQTGNDYTVTLSTQSGWVSGPVTVSVAANAYQKSSNAGNSSALSYTIPVSNVFSTPTLVSVTDGTTTVNASSDTEALLLSGISVKVNVSAVAGDRLLLFLGEQRVATQAVATTGTQQEIDIADSNSKVNGSRLAYSVSLQDSQGNSSEASRLLYVSFDDPNAATAPEISGPVSNASFTDDFSFSESNWTFKDGQADGVNKPSSESGSAGINNGVLQLNDARTWQYALVTQNDLIFSTQGKVVFEATFIFGNTQNPADGIAFFSYDAHDELFYSGRTYTGDGHLVVTHGRLRSLFFAIGLDEFGEDSIRYAPPAANPADLSDLANPTGGNGPPPQGASGWNTIGLSDIWANARHRLRITVENRSVLVERADVDTNGVVDENSWGTMLQRSFPDTAHVPDNIKIGFSSATGAQRNEHAVDDVSVNAELFVPYTVGATPVQASPSGITLTAGEKTDNSSLAISGIRVQINSGYQITDSLTFSGDSTLFTSTLAGDTLTIRTAPGQTPSTAEFLAALNAIRFSTTAEGERTLNWEVFAEDSGSEIRSQSYNSEIRVFSAS